MKKAALTYAIVLVLTGLVTSAAHERMDQPLIGIDDANIYFVFAKNLAEGHGFVYNAGGERVEGTTSPLWTLISTLAYKTGRVELILLVISVLLLALALTVAVLFVQASFRSKCHFGGWGWAAVFLLLVFLMAPFVAWCTVSLMETGLWSSALLVSVVIVLRTDDVSQRRTNVLLGAAVATMLVTRPESMAWAPALLAGVFLVRRTRIGSKEALRATLTPAITCLVVFVSLMLFRLWYFGYPLPNTYYAKVSPSLAFNISDGFTYLTSYMRSNTLVLIGVASVFMGLAHAMQLWRREQRIEPAMLLPVFGLLGLLLPFVTGGDHFTAYRFYQPIYPILILNFFYFVGFVVPHYVSISWRSESASSYRRIFIAIALSAITIVQVGNWQLVRNECRRLYGDIIIAKYGRELGVALTEVFSSLTTYPSVGVTAAGGQKYTYEGEVVDLLGLTNVEMAHNGGLRKGIRNHAAFERETFFELLPDIVYPRLVDGDTWRFSAAKLGADFGNLAFKGLYFDAQFQDTYVFTKITAKQGGDKRAIIGFVLKDYLDRLREASDFGIETFNFDGRS